MENVLGRERGRERGRTTGFAHEYWLKWRRYGPYQLLAAVLGGGFF